MIRRMPRERKRNYKQASILKSLVFYDSPQVMLLRLKDDHYAISVAIESANSELDFLAAEIDEKQLTRYLREQLDLRYLFVYPKWKNWYLFDLLKVVDNAVNLFPADQSVFADEKNLPDGGFFAREHTDEFSFELSGSLDEKSYNIDGNWDLIDFSRFYGKISDLYAFFLSFDKYTSPSTNLKEMRRIIGAFVDPPLQGGSSYVNLFSDLKKTQSYSERLAVHSIQYASPGHITIEGKIDVFQKIDESLQNLSMNYDEIKGEYDKLYRFLQENKLLKSDKRKFDPDSYIAKYIFDEATTLAKKLGVRDDGILYQMVGRNKLSYSKVVLAHFRRMQGYFLFFAEGRVKDG